LEGYLYRLRDLLDGDAETPFIGFSREEERRTLSEGMVDALEWFDNEGQTADAATIWAKRDYLECVPSLISAESFRGY